MPRFELLEELAVMAVSDALRNFAVLQTAVFQQAYSLFNPQIMQHFVKADAVLLQQQLAEINGMQVEDLGQLADRQRLPVVLADVVDNFLGNALGLPLLFPYKKSMQPSAQDSRSPITSPSVITVPDIRGMSYFSIQGSAAWPAASRIWLMI